MAEVVTEIFKINSDTADITKKLKELKGTYQELTAEQQKQVQILNDLQAREKALTEARDKSNNPTMAIKMSKEIQYLGTQIASLKKETDAFTQAEAKAEEQTDKLGDSVSNAFKGTVIAGAAKDIDKVGKASQQAGTAASAMKKELDKPVPQIQVLNKQLNDLREKIIAAGADSELGKELTAEAKTLQTQIGKLEEEYEKLDVAIGTTEKTTSSLKSQLKDLKAQLASGTLSPEEFQKVAEEAGRVKDALDDANEAANNLASGSNFEVFGNQLSDIAGKIINLDFEGAEERSEQLVQTSKKITFKESLAGIKSMALTLFNLGKALLTNPLFLIGSVVALVITNFDKLKNSGGLLGDAFRFIGKIIDGVVDTFYKLVDAIGVTKIRYTEFLNQTIADSEKLAEITKKNSERQIAALKALGVETEKQELAKQQAYVKTLQVALDATKKRGSFTDEEKKAEEELVQKILDAKNEILVIENTSLKKRRDAAKKYAEDINKLFDDLDKRLRELRTKEAEFNLKFKLDDNSVEQLNDLFALRKQLEDQELKDLRKQSLAVVKTKQDRITVESKLALISQQTTKNRTNEFNKALLDLEFANGQKQIEEAKARANALIDLSNDTEAQKANQRVTIEEDGYARSIALLDADIKKRRELGLNTVAQEKAINDLIFANDVFLSKQEKELLDLNFQEATRELEFEKQHQNDILTLKNKTNSRKLFSDLEYEKQRLALLKERYGDYSQEVKKQEDQIALLEKEAKKQRLLEYVSYFETITNAAFSATRQILAAKQQEVDSQISIQQRRVDEAKNIADNGNAELLELEQKRLDDLTKKREQYVRQQQALAAVELIANTAIAVSKAAAEGGVAAGITIATTLISLVAGLASARSIASQAAYFDGGLYDSGGGYTGDGNPYQEQTRFNKPYIGHIQEFIMPHGPTRKYRDIFEDVLGGRVDLRAWKDKASMYDQMVSFKPFTTNAPYIVPNQVNNIIEMKGLESKLDNLHDAISALKFGLNVDEDGFTMMMEKKIKRREFIEKNARR